ncbi:MAG TPA: hypothetical protein P5235_02065 [Saprospiraceae bacterium]|nr:hypothetical protein [Saprospiraceae bacterium]
MINKSLVFCFMLTTLIPYFLIVQNVANAFSPKGVKNSDLIQCVFTDCDFDSIPSLIIEDSLFLKMRNIEFKSRKNGNEYFGIFKWKKHYSNEKFNSIKFCYSSNLVSNKRLNEINRISLDSLIVEFSNGNWQSIIIPEFSASVNFFDLDNPDLKLQDINFDGETDLDLALNDVSGATNALRRYFILNPKKEKFEDGIDFANLRIDSDKRQLYHSWNGGHAGKISDRYWVNIIDYNRTLVLKKMSSEYDDRIKAYIVKNMILLKDGNYEFSRDTIIREE